MQPHFYNSLSEAADLLAKCGEAMRLLLNDLADRQARRQAIDALADRADHQLIVPAGVHDELVGPFHRGDIIDLVHRLAAIVRIVQDAAQLADVTGLDRSLTDMASLGTVLADATAEFGALLGRLLTATADDEAFDRIDALEKAARACHNDGLSTLFSAVGDELQVIKEKEVLDRITRAVREVSSGAALAHRLLATRT